MLMASGGCLTSVSGWIAALILLLSFDCYSSENARPNSTSRSKLVGLSFESEPEKSSQRQYVELLNAKLLVVAHGRGDAAVDGNNNNNDLPQAIHNAESFSGLSRAHQENKRIIHENNPGKFISSYLRKISNDELGITAMQEIYDSLPSVDIVEDLPNLLKELGQKLSKKFNGYLKVLERNKLALEEKLNTDRHSFDFGKFSCCQVPIQILRYDEHFGVDVTRSMGCESYLYSNTSDAVDIAALFLTPTFKSNLQMLPTMLWQYFISINGIHFEYPAHNTDVTEECSSFSDRHRDVFQTSVKNPKLLIMMIEQGYALSPTQFLAAKSVAKHILNLLSAQDKVAVFGLAADVQNPFPSGCSHHKVMQATSDTKFYMARFIESLDRKQNVTNHVLGFESIFETISFYEQHNYSTNEVLITYISRGLLSSIIDAKQVLEIIADGIRNSESVVVINTYAIIDDEKPVMLEQPFMRDVAEQNFKNYNIHFKNKYKVKKGMMVPISSSKGLAERIGDIFSAFSNKLFDGPLFSLPLWDPVSKGMVVAISRQVYYQNELVGITGVDISLADLAEDFSTYYDYQKSSYIFVIEKSGVALVHPSYSLSPFANGHHVHTFIWYLEDKPGFGDICKKILSEPRGEERLIYSSKSGLNINFDAHVGKGPRKSVVYRWRRVDDTPFVIVMASEAALQEHKMLKDTVVPEVMHFMYHRLDLLPASNICRHMKQLSSLGTTALFLSASCFTSPYKYLVEEETKQMVQSYMAYLTDTTKLIANPGLKVGVRSDVLAVSWITPTWEKSAHDSEFSNYIVRRFIATTSGVFQVYPATLIDKMYDPTRRDWYTRALDHPGKIILTAPYLDIGGAGYVVTLSHTIYEGKPTALHSSSDNVAAVMGMDFTFGYFYKLLLEKVSGCKEQKITCFLLDDRGYLIAHPDLIEPSGKGPVEQQHITHKEPLVANDLLNHKEFVEKKVCYSFIDRTIQRYYQLNTSLHGILTNQVHKEHCTKYQIMALRGTNIFLGIVNRTCDGITAFCPCSVTNRLCLNCHRMEPTDCECPCECPLEIDSCSGELIDEKNRYPTCMSFPEEPNLPLVDSVLVESLQPCYEYHCNHRSALSDCFGILGCEWCQLDSDGITLLQNKFCTEQRKCFGGVLGARTPYADEIVEGLPAEQFLIFRSPVGPVAGGFMVLFVAMALVVYCYRNHVRRGMVTHHTVSVPDTNLRMAQLDNEPDEPDIFHEPILPPSPPCPACQGPHDDDNLIVSPYRVHSNYRRPPGGDSDHGYSTMTPHEDSEHTPYFEPLLIGKDKSLVPASQHSLSSCSRASSPLSHCPQTLPPLTYVPSRTKGETILPPWNCKTEAFSQIQPGSYVLAHVEVHSENKH